MVNLPLALRPGSRTPENPAYVSGKSFSPSSNAF
jgi:hypothetical protein